MDNKRVRVDNRIDKLSERLPILIKKHGIKDIERFKSLLYYHLSETKALAEYKKLTKADNEIVKNYMFKGTDTKAKAREEYVIKLKRGEGEIYSKLTRKYHKDIISLVNKADNLCIRYGILDLIKIINSIKDKDLIEKSSNFIHGLNTNYYNYDTNNIVRCYFQYILLEYNSDIISSIEEIIYSIDRRLTAKESSIINKSEVYKKIKNETSYYKDMLDETALSMLGIEIGNMIEIKNRELECKLDRLKTEQHIKRTEQSIYKRESNLSQDINNKYRKLIDEKLRIQKALNIRLSLPSNLNITTMERIGRFIEPSVLKNKLDSTSITILQVLEKMIYIGNKDLNWFANLKIKTKYNYGEAIGLAAIQLEMIDISESINLSEDGLIALYKIISYYY